MPATANPGAAVGSAAVALLAGIGNALMAEPMLRQLRRALPRARLTVLARTAAIGEVAARSGAVDDVHVEATPRAAARWLRAQRLDLLIVPFPSNRWQYSMLARMSGARRVLMHAFPVGRWSAMHGLCRREVPARRGLHDVEQNLELLRPLGVAPDASDRPRFAVRDEEREEAGALLRGAGTEPGAFAALHAGSARTALAAAKRWPVDRFAAVATRLAELGLRSVVVEGPDERGVGREVLRGVPAGLGARVLPLTGSLGLAAAVLEAASLYVGSDSGLAHLAGAVGTPPVTLFAPADPGRVCPHGYRDLVLRTPLPCSPCLKYPWEATRPRLLCRGSACIERIEVDSVVEAARRALSRAAGGR